MFCGVGSCYRVLNGPGLVKRLQTEAIATLCNQSATHTAGTVAFGILRNTEPPRGPLAQLGEHRLCADEPADEPSLKTQETKRRKGWPSAIQAATGKSFGRIGLHLASHL